MCCDANLHDLLTRGRDISCVVRGEHIIRLGEEAIGYSLEENIGISSIRELRCTRIGLG